MFKHRQDKESNLIPKGKILHEKGEIIVGWGENAGNHIQKPFTSFKAFDCSINAFPQNYSFWHVW